MSDTGMVILSGVGLLALFALLVVNIVWLLEDNLKIRIKRRNKVKLPRATARRVKHD